MIITLIFLGCMLEFTGALMGENLINNLNEN